jgi:DNA-binding response OmpR family regulator
MNADGEMRVLVADDEPSMLDIMLRRLSKMGVTPDQASDGATAQALIEQNDYDVIVTDIYMPEVTGLELLHVAKERDPNVQVVVATASATIDNAVDALNNGAFGYLTKPFDHLSVFDKTVTRAMEFRRLLLDNERMAEVQKRRGDMLEQEVTQRIRQLRDRQRDLINLLTSLPLGVAVVEEGGRVVMSNPQAERWLGEEKEANEQPIRAFMASVHETDSEPSLEVVVAGRTIRLTAVDILHGTPKKQKVVIIGEMEYEEEGISQGTMVEEAIGRLNKGLLWLAGQPLEARANNVSRGLVREIVSLGRMMGLDIADPVFPEVVAPPILEAVVEEIPEPVVAPADDDDDERLLAALQASVNVEPDPVEVEELPRRRAPMSGEAPISKPTGQSRTPVESLPVEELEPDQGLEEERASQQVEEPWPEPSVIEEPSLVEEASAPVALGRIDEPDEPTEAPAAAEEPRPIKQGLLAKRAVAREEHPVKEASPREERPAAKEAGQSPKEEKKPLFKSRLLQKAKELESGGWRPNPAPSPKSGGNGKAHEEIEEPPDNSVLSRLAQVTEDPMKPRPVVNKAKPEPRRPPPGPAPKPEPAMEEDASKWAVYEESETGSGRTGPGKGVWPPPLPSSVEDEEEETATEA